MSAAESDFMQYELDQTQRARRAGEDRPAIADREGIDEALDLIFELARSGEEFCADHVRNQQQIGTPATLGAAFGHASRIGWIVPAGVTTARSTTRHGGLQRVWRGAI